jgi:putative flippase GtrA
MKRVAAIFARNETQIRFLIAAGINTAFGLSIYPILLLSFAILNRHYLWALAIAQALSLLFAFAVYKIAVFRTQAGIVGEFGKFASFYLINYAANWIALPLLVEGAGIPPILAQIAFSLVLMLGSWFWHSRITFKSGEKIDE